MYGLDGSLIEGISTLYKESANMVRAANHDPDSFIKY